MLISRQELIEQVCRRIRIAREELNLTQSDVGKQLIPLRSHAAVSDIENGKTHVTMDLLYQFCELFDKSPAWFCQDWEDWTCTTDKAGG